MTENNNNNTFNADLGHLAQQATQQPAPQPEAQVEQTPSPQITTPHQTGQPVQEQAPRQPMLPIADDEHVLGEGSYNGLGIEVDPEMINRKEDAPPAANELDPDRQDDIARYMEQMDADYEEAKETREKLDQINPKEQAMQEFAKQVAADAGEESDSDEEEEEIDAEEQEELFNEKYKEAVVMIDKLGLGAKVNFTDEEREKLTHSKKIRLQEVETLPLQQLKTKKSKKQNIENILKRQPTIHSTPIVLPASGYTASIQGASSYELISLMGSSEDALLDTETKWATLHSKLTNTSLGNMNFNDFLRATASIDYNMLVYGLLCATYPDDDKLPLTCNNKDCGKNFDHEYSVSSLLRVEKMTEELMASVSETVDGSHTEEGARAIHAKAPVNQVKRIKLPVSEYILDIYIQSGHELIYNSIKGLSKNREEKYNQAAILSTVIKTAYLEDPNEPESYFEYTDAIDITKLIYSLQDRDILVLSKQGEAVMDDHTFEFGLMNVKCPHCGDYRETVPFDIESILFYRYQQAMNTEIE